MHSGARVLADTNVWIAFFRGERAGEGERKAAEALDRLIAEDRVVLCGVVEMELFSGLREAERTLLESHLSVLPYLDTDREDFRRAGEILGTLRQQGVTIPAPDALIAALCLRHELPLLEFDKHFAHIVGLERIPWREEGEERGGDERRSS